MALRRDAGARAGAPRALTVALRGERDSLVRDLLARRSSVPSYAADDGAAVLSALADDVGALVDALCNALEHERPVTVHDVAFLRPPIGRRAARGDPMADTALGLRVIQRGIYERVATLAHEAGDPHAALAVGARLMELLDVATAVAGEEWGQASLDHGGASARRRELLELALRGQTPERGELADLAREVGLHAGATGVVVSARACDGATGEASYVTAVGALSRAGRPVVLPLAAVLHDELVVLRPCQGDEVGMLIADLGRTVRRLADGPIRLAVGVSCVHALSGGAPHAHREARAARALVPAGGGIVALAALGALDWMALQAGNTTWCLVPEPVREFIEADAAAGGALLETLRAYVASDLSLKDTARRLHVHVNTLRHRLARIAERTALDLRRVEDVIALHVALRLHEAGASGSDRL